MRHVIGKVRATINGQSTISIAAQSPLSQSIDIGTGQMTISLDQTGIASKAELATKVDSSLVGAVNGIATLDSSGKVPSSQLPWDPIICNYNDRASFPSTGQTGKLYIANDTNLMYRWDGSGYVLTSPSVGLGETSSDAYRGDRGKVAYEHSQATGNPHFTNKADIGLGNVDNTSDLDKPVSSAMQTALDAKVDNSKIGASQGVAELDVNSRVPVSRLTGFTTVFPTTGETGKIYVDNNGKLYEWNGLTYVYVGERIALGTTSSTAFRGDFGQAAYEHMSDTNNPHGVTKAHLGLSNVPNVSTNDQVPTYTSISTLTALSSGEKFSTIMGKLQKAVADEISHHGDTTVHITASERTSWNNKVDKVTGKALSDNNYTTAEKQKLEGIESQAQVNEVSALQHAEALGIISYLCKEIKSTRESLTNLILGMTAPITKTVVGTKGFGWMPDAATGSITSIKVDPSLSGTTLYVQARFNATNTWQQATGTVNSSGVVNVSSLTTVTGANEIYVATTAYVFTVPSVAGGSAKSTTIGWDGYPTNGVDFTAVYTRDKELAAEVDKSEYDEDQFMEFLGYKVTYTAYANTAAAVTDYNAGKDVYVKHENIRDKTVTYSKCAVVPGTMVYYRSDEVYYKRSIAMLE